MVLKQAARLRRGFGGQAGSKKQGNRARLNPAEVRLFQRKLLTWYERNGQHDFIWRKNPTPYRVLVAEVMLQQTQVARVEPKYREFLRRYPNFRALAAADTMGLLTVWSGLGYNRRALMLRACAREVIARHGGRLPTAHADLLALPGIGPYTAAAINVFARNLDEVCIDTNVRRVLIHELGLPHTISHPALVAIARQVLPVGRSRIWHSALMDYGRMVATSRATGVRPKSGKSAPFIGSDRYYRGQILKLLLARRRTLRQSAASLGVPVRVVKKIVQQMERDGLVVVRGGLVSLSA